MSNTNVYNLRDLEVVSAGDLDFLKLIAKTFIDTVPQYLEELQSSFDQADWEKVGMHAHKIKSTVDCIGISSLKNEIRAIEALGKERKNLEKLPSLIEQVTVVLQECCFQLKNNYQI